MEFNAKFEGIPCVMVETREEDKKWFDVRREYDFGEFTKEEAEKFYKYDWENGRSFNDVFTGRFRKSGFTGGQRDNLHFSAEKVDGTDKVHVTMFTTFLDWKDEYREGCLLI